MTKKAPIEQSELFKTDVGWFHIFKELIRNKTWAKLSSNSKSLYPVIKAYANHKSGEAFPSIDTLQEFSGLARASVVKALKELEAEGLLAKSGAAGRHNNYSLIEKFEVTDSDGRPAASVSFDYMPALVGDAVAELKNFMAKGMTMPDGGTQFIKIENLTLNITQNIVDKQINASVVGATELAKIKSLLGKTRD
jgi:hypothetical protein